MKCSLLVARFKSILGLSSGTLSCVINTGFSGSIEIQTLLTRFTSLPVEEAAAGCLGASCAGTPRHDGTGRFVQWQSRPRSSRL